MTQSDYCESCKCEKTSKYSSKDDNGQQTPWVFHMLFSFRARFEKL